MAKNQPDVVERDANDAGVPMVPASGPRTEPTGPEDALGLGPKRGDYSQRLGGSSYNPHTVVAVEHEDDEGNVQLEYVQIDQKESVEGSFLQEEAGVKGGVDTHSDTEAAASATGRRSGPALAPAAAESSGSGGGGSKKSEGNKS